MGGDLSEVYSATIGWNFEDDNGVPHSFVLPKSLFVPGATSRLLSPHHWAQVAKDNYPLPHGTWCGTFDDTIVLQWKQRRFTRTIGRQRGPSLLCSTEIIVPTRLLSPQHWAQVAKDNYPLPHGTWCGTFDDTIVLQWKQRRFTRTILLDVGETNVGTLYTTPPGYARYAASAQKGASTTTTLARSSSRSTAILLATMSQTTHKSLNNGTMPNPFSKGTRHYRRTSTLTARRIQRHQM
jgi:hypothetical protein